MFVLGISSRIYGLIWLMILEAFFSKFICLVMWQKGESQNGCFKKTKQIKFSEKRTFLTPWYAHVRVLITGVRNVRFFGKFGMLSFLETPVLSFALLPYYRRFVWSWCAENLFWKASHVCLVYVVLCRGGLMLFLNMICPLGIN